MRGRSRRLSTGVGLLLLALPVTGCTQESERALPVTWTQSIEPMVEALCVRCHSGTTPAGDYRLTSYHEALGVGSDTVANAIAGDAESRLLTVLEGDHLEFLGEADQREERRARLIAWVVDHELAYFWSAGHRPGTQNPASIDFHGKRVAADGWLMESCRECHGADYAGGVVEASCLGCHTETPEACDTCHGADGSGAPPATLLPDRDPGAHQVHLMAPTGRAQAVVCETCHLVPASLDAEGHVDVVDLRAEVTFGGTATANGAVAAYDAETQSCQSTWCHGSLDGGLTPSPVWTDSGIADGCDGCHGAPPAMLRAGGTHPAADACEFCHPNAGAGPVITDSSLHLDGVVELRPGLEECDGCHSAPEAPVPWRDALGRTDPTLRGVGAHAVHVGPGLFHAEQGGTLGYPCWACHAVPQELGDPGHVEDGIAEVVFGPQATAFGSNPTWDPVTGTCSDVWCHGAGLAPLTPVTPVWTDPTARVICASCHALPPATVESDGSGRIHPSSTACSACHQRVIDGNFDFIDASLHANGTVELGP